MRIKKCLLGILLLVAIQVNSQNHSTATDQEGVTKTIQQLFEGMQKGDSATVHAAFTKEVTFATVFRNKKGEQVMHRESAIHDFLVAVGTPHNDVWNEEIWNLQIQVDGDFAQAWCDYAFYVGKNFSHCGVDAFHLIKTETGWKIFHLADTRRKEGCVIPEAIRKKYE